MLLFIHNGKSTFVANDIKILTALYDVKEYCYLPSKKFSANFCGQAKLLFWLVRWLRKAEIIYIWFGDYHSLLPVWVGKLFKKKVYLVVGGYDIANFSEYGYGGLIKPLRRFFILQSFKHATLCLAVSSYVQKGLKQLGYDSALVYNGVETQSSEPIFLKEKLVLSVNAVDSFSRFKIKGVDLFIEVARELPEFEFCLIGVKKKLLKNIRLPVNLCVLEALPHAELTVYYAKAKVYAQFSLVESFCLAVAEAMLAGCVPVVAAVGALPEVGGEAAYYLSSRHAGEASSLIKKAMLENTESSVFRRRIIANFTLEQRAERLKEILKCQI